MLHVPVSDILKPITEILEPSTIYKGFASYLVVITIVGVTANLAVVYTIFSNNKLYIPKNILLLHLAVTDFIIALLGNPIVFHNSLAGGWTYGDTVCVLYGFFMSLFGSASVFTLTALACQRYIIICRPFSTTTVQTLSWSTAKMLIIGIWLSAFVIASPPLFGFGYYKKEVTGISCSMDWKDQEVSSINYALVLSVFNFGIPLCLIIFSYTSIWRKLKRINRNLTALPVGASQLRQCDTKVARMILIMILVFFISWAPYVIFSVWSAFTEVHLDDHLAIIPSLIARSNVCYNPIIYFFLNHQFREIFLRHLGFRQPRARDCVENGNISMSRVETARIRTTE